MLIKNVFMAAMELFDEAIDEAGEPMDVARLEGYRGILDKIIHDDILLNVMTSRLDIGRIGYNYEVEEKGRQLGIAMVCKAQ